MTNNNLTQTKWADHVRGCADLAKEIATRLDIRDDPARQAMLATIIISADRHNIFLEPIPESQVNAEASASSVPSDSPRPAPPTMDAAELATLLKLPPQRQEPPKGEVVGNLVTTSISARGEPLRTLVLPPRQEPPKGEVLGENQGAIRNPTPEQAEGAHRTVLLKGINSARELLKFTPKALNEYIQEKLKTHKTLGSLDIDELSLLTEKLSKRIDAEKKKEGALVPPIGLPPIEPSELEDWP